MKKLMLSLGLIAVGMLTASSVFAQNIAFMYNKGQASSTNNTIYVKIYCNGVPVDVPSVVLTAPSNSTSSPVQTVANSSLTPYCAAGANVTIGISADNISYLDSCNKVVQFTTAATPQASFTIDYTNGNPPYQCF